MVLNTIQDCGIYFVHIPEQVTVIIDSVKFKVVFLEDKIQKILEFAIKIEGSEKIRIRESVKLSKWLYIISGATAATGNAYVNPLQWNL